MNSRLAAIEHLRQIATAEGPTTLESLQRQVDAIWDFLLDEARTRDDTELEDAGEPSQPG